MIKKFLFLLLVIMPANQYALTINNWKFFCGGSAALSLSALLVWLNILDANNKEYIKKQNDAEYANIKNALSSLNVKFRDYYGYERAGNKVNTGNIIHETYMDIPSDITDEELAQVNSYRQIMSDLKKEINTPLTVLNEKSVLLVLLLGISGLALLSGSIEC